MEKIDDIDNEIMLVAVVDWLSIDMSHSLAAASQYWLCIHFGIVCINCINCVHQGCEYSNISNNLHVENEMNKAILWQPRVNTDFAFTLALCASTASTASDASIQTYQTTCTQKQNE